LSEYIDLLWFDERAPQRVRQQASWVEHLREAPKQTEWITGEVPAGPPQAVRDKRDVTRALARVPPSDATSIARAMEEAIDEDGIFVRPLVVVNGELTMAFDPLEVLRTTIAVASQLAVTDKKLKETVDAASEIAEAPRMTPGPLVDGATVRVRQAFAQANRSLPSDYLESSVQRLLLEERRYQRRTLLGGPRLCGLLAHGGPGAPLPTYLPEHLAPDLPLFPRFRVRALVEPHAQQDPAESEPIALLVLALGRSVPVAGARSGRAS
jgi:hypothetical protein